MIAILAFRADDYHDPQQEILHNHEICHLLFVLVHGSKRR